MRMVARRAMDLPFAVTDSLTVSFSRVLSQILLFSGRIQYSVAMYSLLSPIIHLYPISSAPVELKLPVPGYHGAQLLRAGVRSLFFS